jgi:hypothetical protein
MAVVFQAFFLRLGGGGVLTDQDPLQGGGSTDMERS